MNKKALKEIFKKYPEVVWKEDEDGSIFIYYEEKHPIWIYPPLTLYLKGNEEFVKNEKDELGNKIISKITVVEKELTEYNLISDLEDIITY